MLRRLTPVLVAMAAALTTLVVLVPAPAHAAARVTIANPDGDAVVDPTYATTLTLRGAGFQSIRNGHGGIYVFFGAVRDGWRPSRGGATGVDYFYVPDSESADNQGFQRFVAFPGSDTADSANGGTIGADGRWSTTITVPGAVFDAYDRDGGARRIDCRRMTCGIITVGAHGVTNAANETFTPVRVARLTGQEASASPSATPTADPTAGSDPTAAAPTAGPAATASGSAAPADPGDPIAPAGPSAVEVDRGSARAGHALSFTASGLPAGRQVTVVFDDGAAAAGPFLVGADGRIAGVVPLPVDTGAGTHELRVYGVDHPPTVSFAVLEPAPATAATAAASAGTGDSGAARLFAVGSALVLLLAGAHVVRQLRRSRRAR